MSYFTSLGLNKEPFSTSPDPAFFYHSQEHSTALKRLEIAIRLRRGLSLILGDVGTGKTTLARTMLNSFNDNHFIFHMMLDPTYKSEYQFLQSISRMFGIDGDSRSTMDYKDELERYLYQKGVEQNKTIILLIDEGQKLTSPFLEVLRTLLNYETNEYKLLQLVIMAQLELLPRIRKVRNFMDRVSLKYIINPLTETEIKEMIDFRLQKAGYNGSGNLFTEDAVKEIYYHTQGYPRRISMLCHTCLEHLIMKDRAIVDSQLVREIIKEEERHG